MSTQTDIAWHTITPGDVEGRGWHKTEKPFGRLPDHAKPILSDEIWSYSHSSIGMCVRFVTNSTHITARWELASPQLGEANFPAASFSGLDLYAWDQNTWRWAGGSGNGVKNQNPSIKLVDAMDGHTREFMLYLPARNPVLALEVGIEPSAQFELLLPRNEPSMVFYGSSIVHGAYASHSGIIHPSLLGRWLNRPVINLGFSGCARMELEIAQLLGELDASIYVIDPLPNMDASLVQERAEVFLECLHQAQPHTPILMVEDRTLTNAWIQPTKLAEHQSKRQAYKLVYDRLKDSGMNILWYHHGETLLGTDNESSLDSSHPSDLGYMRIANSLLPKLTDLFDQRTSQ